MSGPRETTVNWCSSCQIPTTNGLCYSCGRRADSLLKSSSLRPVFAEEISLMGRLTGIPLMAEPADLVLWRSGRDYYAAGRKVARLVGGGWNVQPRLQVHDVDLLRRLQGHKPGRRPAWLTRDAQSTRELLAVANGPRLVYLEEEVVAFLRGLREQYPGLPLVVSWSGGKDSTVVSLLAQRAFPEERIIHLFADTTIELPCTYDYLREFRAAYPSAPMLVSLPARDFLDLCREIGPPSRIQRWCCTTQKAAPLSTALRTVAGGGRVLAVSGLRSCESRRRESYPRVIDESKVGLQILVSPILYWSDWDVWAWTIAHSAPVNRGYREGQNRIGCAYCPDAPKWGDMVAAASDPQGFAAWERVLIEVADSAAVVNPREYVSSNAWRGRRGGGIGARGLPGTHLYEVRTRPCTLSDCATFYELAEVFDPATLAELMKPLGKVTVVSSAAGLAEISVQGPRGLIRITAVGPAKYVRAIFPSTAVQRRLEGTLRLQLRKAQACVGCGGCAALCPHGAITGVGPEYRVREDLCTGCLRCVREVKAGCWAAHSLNRSERQASPVG